MIHAIKPSDGCDRAPGRPDFGHQHRTIGARRGQLIKRPTTAKILIIESSIRLIENFRFTCAARASILTRQWRAELSG
jgi:hypothetical protein